MKIIELRPDSKLLKSNFDGYKLSLEPIPVLKQENIKPDIVRADTSSEYSFLHSSLFQLQNHLIRDPWLSYSAYFIDSTFAIQKIQYDQNDGRMKPVLPIFKCSIKRPSTPGIYNVNFHFINEKYAILSDGIGGLVILDTGDRQKNNEWKQIQNFKPLDCGFIIQDGKLQIENGEKQIHCLLLHIEQHEDDSKFFNVINWITLKEISDTKKWEVAGRKIIQSKGNLNYLSFDLKCKSIVYSSNQSYKYTFDSINPVEDEPEIVPAVNLQYDESVNTFKWSQNGEDITINFNQISNATKDKYSVKCQLNHIEVNCDSKVLVNSDLFSEIDVDLTTWSLENNFIQLNLIKKSPEIIWPYLIPGGPIESDEKKQLLDAALVSDLNSQMEECDFGEQDDEHFIERIDGTTHKGTHKIFLGSNNPLFCTVLRPGQPKALAIRNDIDCCLWQQQMNDTDWYLKHEGTLHAFGYIQASKRERKFLQCSPDLNLAVISETSRHLFIYKNSYPATGLRKRIGQQLTIGQQKLVSFDNNGEILGISVENEIVLLLTESAICCLQLNIEE